MMPRPYTLVYDGNCAVCARFVNVVRGWDRDEAVEVVPSQAGGVTARFPWISAAAYAESIQLVGPNGVTWQGAAAIEQLLRVLPRRRWIAWLMRLPVIRTAADRFYRWFARNRYHFGCNQHCKVQRSFESSSLD